MLISKPLPMPKKPGKRKGKKAVTGTNSNSWQPVKTSPGKMKKMVGAKSAKAFAPGQRKKQPKYQGWQSAVGGTSNLGTVRNLSTKAKPAVSRRGGTAGKLAQKAVSKGKARTRTRKR